MKELTRDPVLLALTAFIALLLLVGAGLVVWWAFLVSPAPYSNPCDPERGLISWTSTP